MTITKANSARFMNKKQSKTVHLLQKDDPDNIVEMNTRWFHTSKLYLAIVKDRYADPQTSY